MGLKEITARLLQTESEVESMHAAAELHAFFSGIAKISDDVQNLGREDTQLSEGKAISPDAAARCILDYKRTKSFLSGVIAAVVETRRRFPGQTIHILYAGCGPFAPLALPLTTQFTSDQVHFTLLDIHNQSLDSVRQIVETLGVSAYVRDYVQCDATSYQNPSESAPHIILIETMQKALAKEPQVAVTRNLVPQLHRGGVLIPETIALDACLADLSKELVLTPAGDSDSIGQKPRRDRIHLGTVFELTAESSQQPWNQCSGKANGAALCSTPVNLCVPKIPDDTYDLMILTSIKVFDSIMLRDYESGLTYPTVLYDLGRIHSNDQLEFKYVTGEKPGLRWRLV